MKHSSFSRVAGTLVLFVVSLVSTSQLKAGTCPAAIVDDITHQGARVHWGAPPGENVANQRLQYGKTTSYGSILGSITPQLIAAGSLYLSGMTLSGLLPNTTYHVGGQTTPDSSTWCTPTDVALTTLPLPTVHPVPPLPPATFDTSTPPAVTGATWTVGANCADFQSCLSVARFGDQIVIPAGMVVTPGTTIGSSFQFPAAFDAVAISSVNTATGTFTTATPHGFANGQKLRLSSASKYLPSPIQIGATYYVVNATGTTFQLSRTSGGPALTAFADSGAGTLFCIPWPLAENRYITIRTSTPDSQLPPPGTRIDPSYAPKLAIIRNSVPYNNGGALMRFDNPLSHHYWFIGIQFDTAPYAVAGAVTSPKPYMGVLATNADNSNIVVDRCYWKGPGYPNRWKIAWDAAEGSNLAVINSYIEHLDYWRPYQENMSVSNSDASHLSVAPGTFHLGSSVCALANTATAAITSGGGVTGTSYVYFDMGCTLRWQLPAGVTATGSGIAISSNPSPAWPTDSHGDTAAGQLASVALNSGSITSINNLAAYDYASPYGSEGSYFWLSFRGPGPYKFENNYMQSEGIPLFWADDNGSKGFCLSTCPAHYTLGDIAVRRNTIMADATHIAGAANSDGRAYSHRNTIECKTCNRLKISGNRFPHASFREVTPRGPILAFNATSNNTPPGYDVQTTTNDIEVAYNTATQNSSFFYIGAHGIGSIGPVARAAKRVWVHDNLLYGNNGWRAASVRYTGANSDGTGSGLLFLNYYGVEDFQITHNTFWGAQGNGALVTSFGGPFADGWNVRDNFFGASSDGILNYADPNNTGGGGSATVPSYQFVRDGALLAVMPAAGTAFMNNVFLSTYQVSGPPGSEVELSQSQADTLAALVPGAPATIWPTGATLAARAAVHGFFDSKTTNNFRLKPSSPFISGAVNKASDGLSVGADIDALEAEQGLVGNVRSLGITATTANVAFLAPDAFGCSVDWSTDGMSTWTRVANPGGQRVQAVALAGLPSNTAITYRVNCAVQQPSGGFTTLPGTGSALTGAWANSGEDKVLQGEVRASNGDTVNNSAWDGTTINVWGAKNEVVNFNLILEAKNSAASNVSVSFNSLTGPGGVTISSAAPSTSTIWEWTVRNIELFYVRYLQIKGLSHIGYNPLGDERNLPPQLQRPQSTPGAGTGTWADRPGHDQYFPEIAIPLELQPSFTIAQGKSQSIWCDIYIPKTAPSGFYSGTLTVTENGAATRTIPVSLRVRDFTLPDKPTSKTALAIEPARVSQRETGVLFPDGGTQPYIDSDKALTRLVSVAHRHKISIIGDWGNLSNDFPEPVMAGALKGTLFSPANGYGGPGLNTGQDIYCLFPFIGPDATWGATQSAYSTHLAAWDSWFAANASTVNRFVYLGDEINDSTGMARLNTEAGWMSGSGTQTKSFVTNFLDLVASTETNVQIGANTSLAAYNNVGDNRTVLPSAASVIRARPGGEVWWYNPSKPWIGSFATEEDGIAVRVNPWVEYSKGIDRLFLWNSTYWSDSGSTDVFNQAATWGANGATTDPLVGQYTPVYSNGNGVLFYPSKDTVFPGSNYGQLGVFASLRLKYWRRGIQDIDYVALAKAINPTATQAIVNATVPKSLWDVHDLGGYTTEVISWPVNPDNWETARSQLAAIIAP